MSKKDAAAQPMDPSINETATPVQRSANPRNAYTIDTIIAEVLAIYPDTPYEVGDRTALNVATSVRFDLVGAAAPDLDDSTDAVSLPDLLALLDVTDPRLAEISPSEGYVRVRASARTQDSREPFGFAEAWDTLIGPE